MQVKGRTAVKTAADGTFSFPVPGNSFFIQSVKKQGYILVDPEAITRQYTYSSNPITLALVIPTEQADDKLAKERQIRNTLEKKLHAREDEIEDLKAQNKISQEDYRKELQRLYAEQESNEKLIKEMAERYTKIDFDELDEFNLRISDCILNGRLTEADSLLRTKGDINARIEKLNKQHEANIETRDNLEKSEAMEQKDREDIAQDCGHFIETFYLAHQNDSAARYIKILAELDTNDVELQNVAGDYLSLVMANDSLALHYYQRALQQSLLQNGEDNEWTASSYNDIATIYSHKDNFDKALDYHFKALSIQKKVLGNDHLALTDTYTKIGDVYSIMHDSKKAVEYYSKAMEILEKNQKLDDFDAVNTYSSIGVVYMDQKDYNNALVFLMKAHNIIEKELELKKLDKEFPIIASSYNDIACAYDGLGEYAEALEYHFKALNIREKVLGKEHPQTASSYHNIGSVYLHQGDLDHALEYNLKALNIDEKHDKDGLESANSYISLGSIYEGKGDNYKALEYYQKALNIYETVLGEDNVSTIKSNYSIGMIYNNQGYYDKALEYYQKALDSQEKTLGKNHTETAISYFTIGLVYQNLGNYDKALEYIFKALEIQDNQSDKQFSEIANLYNAIAGIYYSQSDFNKALEYKVKEVNIQEQTLGTNHPDLVSNYKSIGIIYYNQSNYDKALEFLLKALDIKERITEKGHPDFIEYYNILGLLYSSVGNKDKGLEYYLKALPILEQTFGLDLDVAASCNNIGWIYYNQKNYGKAIEYFQKSFEIKKVVLGTTHPDVIETERDLNNTQYAFAISTNNIKEFLLNHCFISIVVNGGPAQQQGMEGEYILLEFADWTENSPVSLFDKNAEYKGKPKDIVVLKDGVISKHHFEDVMGVQLGVKEITKEDRERINQLYKTWKRDQALLDVWNSRKKENSINKQSD